MGKGGRSDTKVKAAARRDDFIYRDQAEPHASRKTEILKAHPEIKELMGPTPWTKYCVAGTVALQIFMAIWTQDWSWPYYLAAVYVVGATANHSLFLAIHELSHMLGFKNNSYNKLCGMIANWPIVFPYCITFKDYHMAHHRYQGEDGIDTDIPTWLEGWLITSTTGSYIEHTVKKALFMFCQIFAYALRPMLVKPDLMPSGSWLMLNWAVQFSFDAAMAYFFGFKVMWYFLLSTFFAGSIHPTAGHFIAEHYVMEDKAETYSYYGPLNMLTYNVGYHNEHHDFPNIAWTNLPKVREIAPEFYNDLPQCKSWPGAIFRYIFDDSIGPFSRVKRSGSCPDKQGEAKKTE